MRNARVDLFLYFLSFGGGGGKDRKNLQLSIWDQILHRNIFHTPKNSISSEGKKGEEKAEMEGKELRGSARKTRTNINGE